MKNMKFWRTALVATLVLTVMLSVTGGTIAWFTDSVTSNGNKIEAGTLDIDLYKLTNNTAEPWEEITDNSQPLFNSVLWEPGYTAYQVLKVQNNGTLALKWKTQITSDAELNKLADVIDVYTKVGVTELPTGREGIADWQWEATLADFIKNAEGKTIGSLEAKNAATLGIALKMREEADNQYQGLSLGNLDIKIVATQDTVELDSFGKDYDENATYPGEEPKKEWKTPDVVTQDTTIDGSEYENAEKYDEILLKSGNLTLKNATFENGLTIYTELSSTGTVTLENCTIYLSDGVNKYSESYNQAQADYGLTIGAISPNVSYTFKNCTFTAKEGHTYTNTSNSYNVYIASNYSADSIAFEGCTFEKSGKHGIGCSYGIYGPAEQWTYYDLTVTGCNFVDWNNNSNFNNGAAIRGNVTADVLENKTITITGNIFGNSNNSTQTKVAIDGWNGTWN